MHSFVFADAISAYKKPIMKNGIYLNRRVRNSHACNCST